MLNGGILFNMPKHVETLFGTTSNERLPSNVRNVKVQLRGILSLHFFLVLTSYFKSPSTPSIKKQCSCEFILSKYIRALKDGCTSYVVDFCDTSSLEAEPKLVLLHSHCGGPRMQNSFKLSEHFVDPKYMCKLMLYY